ncbi:MAG: hypothetical protein EBT92_16225 [Planctomycetes bacterium]|nr:hypothetical protein [Planctomycetota bacterium]
MGTRSLTRVKNEDGQTILTLYRQMDGYPEGHGKELVDFLDGMVITNGISLGAKPAKSANGMECLAAQLVAHFKTGVGGFYIYPDTADDQEYNYLIEMINGELTLTYEGHNEHGTLLPKIPSNKKIVEFLYPTVITYGVYTDNNVWRKIEMIEQTEDYITGIDLNDGRKFKKFLIERIVGGKSKIFTVNK